MWERSSLMQELVEEAADARQEDGQRSTQVRCSVLPIGLTAAWWYAAGMHALGLPCLPAAAAAAWMLLQGIPP